MKPCSYLAHVAVLVMTKSSQFLKGQIKIDFNLVLKVKYKIF